MILNHKILGISSLRRGPCCILQPFLPHQTSGYISHKERDRAIGASHTLSHLFWLLLYQRVSTTLWPDESLTWAWWGMQKARRRELLSRFAPPRGLQRTLRRRRSFPSPVRTCGRECSGLDTREETLVCGLVTLKSDIKKKGQKN